MSYGKRIAGVMFSSLLILACGGSDADEAAPAKEKREKKEKKDAAKGIEDTGKIDPKKNPFAMLSAAADAAREAGERMESAAARGPVEPVRFDALLQLLAEPLPGWTAEEPKGNTTTMGEFKQTVVSRAFRTEDGKRSVRMEITDGAFNEMVYMPFRMMANISQESTEGFQKGVTIDGNPGFESWNKGNKSSELWVLVGDRFLVHLNGDGMESGGIREWLGRVDLAKLAALAKG